MGAGLVIIANFCMATLLALSGSQVWAQEEVPEEEPAKRGGWITSGKSFPLPVSYASPKGSIQGIITNLMPAKEIRDLLSLNDTLWIGTDGGLFAYGIAEDTVFSVGGPVSTSIRSIAVDDTGFLWVGGDDGISVRRNEGWIHYTRESNRFLEDVTDIVDGEGKVWVGTFGNGFAYIKDDSITVFSREDSLLDDRVLAIVEETPYSIWIGTASGLCRADTLKWESMRYGRRIPVGAIEDLIFDEEGNLFLAIARQGVAQYNLGRVRVYRPNDGLPSWEIHDFNLDPMGKVWAVGNSGLSTFDGSGWIPYRLPGVPLGRYRFLTIHHDVEGTCFLGSDEGKLIILSRDSIKEIFIPQEFPSRRVARIRIFDDAVWFLTERSIYKLQGDLHEIEPPPELYMEALTDIVADERGELWVASRFGILHLSGRFWEVFDRRQGLPTEYFNTAQRDAQGNLWFGTFDRGVLRFSGEGWLHYTEKNGLPDNRIVDLLVDDAGVVWAVAGEGKLARFQGEVWEEIVFPYRDSAQLARLQDQDSMLQLDPSIRFLSELDGQERGQFINMGVCLGLDGRGNCLVGRRDGIYRFTVSGWQFMDLPHGHAGIEPSAVLGTSRGEIWIGTSSDGVFIQRRGEWVHVGTLSGLADDHIMSISEDGAGRIYIGTQFGGVARFTPIFQ